MIKLYGIILLVAILGGVGYGAKYYLSVLRENNAIRSSIQTASESVNKLQGDIQKMASLNKSLQQDYKSRSVW